MQVVTDVELRADADAEKELAEIELRAERELNAVAKRARSLEKQARELRTELQQMHEVDVLGRSRVAGDIEIIEDSLAEVYEEYYRIIASVLGGDYTPAEVGSWYRRAAEVIGRHPDIRRGLVSKLVRCRMVPNARFRAIVENLGEGSMAPLTRAFHRKLVEMEETEGNLGSGSLIGPKDSPQVIRLRRLLGMATQVNSRGEASLRIYITYEEAVAFAAALDIHPHEVGV